MKVAGDNKKKKISPVRGGERFCQKGGDVGPSWTEAGSLEDGRIDFASAADVWFCLVSVGFVVVMLVLMQVAARLAIGTGRI